MQAEAAWQAIKCLLLKGKRRKKKRLLSISSSSLVNHILCEAFEKNKKFRVIVVDSRPRLEGREALRRLVQKGIRCTYVLISAVSYILPEARIKHHFFFSFWKQSGNILLIKVSPTRRCRRFSLALMPCWPTATSCLGLGRRRSPWWPKPLTCLYWCVVRPTSFAKGCKRIPLFLMN